MNTIVLLIFILVIAICIIVVLWRGMPRNYAGAFTGAADNNSVLVPFDDLSQEQIKQMAAITSIPENMEAIGISDTWNEQKITRMVEFAKRDKDDPARQYFSWAIVDISGNVIGFIGLRPFRDHDGLQLRYLVTKPQRRKGYAAKALKEIIVMAKKRGIPLYAVIEKENTASIASIKKVNFNPAGQLDIKGVSYSIYKL